MQRAAEQGTNWIVKSGCCEQLRFKAEQLERHLTTCISYTESSSKQTVPNLLQTLLR